MFFLGARPRPIGRSLVVGFGSGVLVALSLPPFGWWPLACLGIAGVAVALPGASGRARAGLGAGLGIGEYSVGAYWVHEFSIPGLIGLVVISAAYTTLALVACPAARRRSVVLGLPAVLLLSDWVRNRYPLGGFPLGGIPLGQAGGPLVGGARLGGGLLITADVALAGLALAEFLHALVSWRLTQTPGQTPRSARLGAARTTAGCGAVALAALAIPMAGRLSPDGGGGHLAPLRVALVQGGGPRGTRAIYTDPQVVFLRHLETSETIDRPVDLVVWPEGVLQSHLPFESGSDAQAVSQLARRLEATVLVGVEQDVGVRRYLNEVVAWGPSGQILASYEKNHLVPFGEYVPYRSVLGRIFNFKDVPYDGIAGHAPGYISTPAGPIGVMISFEVFFDDRARGAVRAGGQLLVVPTNTASYRGTQVPGQELAAARIRAWETGRWVLQVTPTGYSAVVTPLGVVQQRSALDERAVVYATVPRLTGRTVYVELGDTPFALAAVGLLIVAWYTALEGTRWSVFGARRIWRRSAGVR